MNETINPLEGIRDIAPPAMPWQLAWESSAPFIIIISLLAIALLIVILQFFWQRYFSPRGKAQRQISILQHQHDSHSIDSHHAAFQLARILRDALNITQLSTHTSLPENIQEHKARWINFNESLSIARYSSIKNSETAELLTDARFWLRCWPRTKHA